MHSGPSLRASGKDHGYYHHREQQQQHLIFQSGYCGTTPRFQNVTTRNDNQASMCRSQVVRYPNKRSSHHHGDNYPSHMIGNHGSESNQIHHKEDSERVGWQSENDRNNDGLWGETREQGYKNYNRGDVPPHNENYDFDPNGDQRYQPRSGNCNNVDQYYTYDRYENQHDKPQNRELGYLNKDYNTLNSYESTQSLLIQGRDSRYGNAGHRHNISQPKHEDFGNGNEDYARNTNEVLMPFNNGQSCNDENYGQKEGDQDNKCEDSHYDYNIGNKDNSQGVHCDSSVGAGSHDASGNQDSMYLYCNAPGKKMMHRRYHNQRTDPRSFDFNDSSSHSAWRETFDPRCAAVGFGSDTNSNRHNSNNTNTAGHTFCGGESRKRGGGGGPWKDRCQVQFGKMLDMYLGPGSRAGNTLERVNGRGSSFVSDTERHVPDNGKNDVEKSEDGRKWTIGFPDSRDGHQAKFGDSGIKKFGKKRKDFHIREQVFEGRPGKKQKVDKRGKEGEGVLKSAKSVPLSNSAGTAPTRMQSASNVALLVSCMDDTDDINPGEKSKKKCRHKIKNTSSHFGWPQSASLRGCVISAQKATTGKAILFASSSGVGLYSLRDIIRSARARQLVTPISMKPDVPAEESMTTLVEHWKMWALPSVSLTNPITAVECSLTTFKVRFLQLHYSHQPLTRCDKYCVFTGTLRLSKATESAANDGIFLVRGFGLSPKTAKLDVYEKAYTLVMGSTVSDILSQEDCGHEVLSQEITHLLDDNQTAFLALLKRTITIEGQKLRALVNPSTKWPFTDDNKKRTAKVPLVQKPKSDCKPSALLKAYENALRITKEVFNEKLIMLKKILETEVISKCHIVPKMDHLAFRADLSVLNVYRFEHVTASSCR